MNAFTEERSFELDKLIGPSDVLFSAEEAAPGEETLLGALEALPDGGLLVINLTNVRVSSEAARRLLRRALRRVAEGELSGRFIVVFGLESSRYNIDVMLQGEKLVAVERLSNGTSRLVGRAEPAVIETYQYLMGRRSATASDVKNHFQLENTSTATNRLTKLWKLALARRIEESPLPGGGKQYVYAAVK